MPDYFRWTLFLSVEWWLLLLPKTFDVFSILTEPIHRLIYPLVTAIAGDRPFFEDSSGMYVLLVAAIVLGFATALLIAVPAVKRRFSYNPFVAMHMLIRYFLILELWEYGWAKLTKMQFYLPEPNIVYTELGTLSKDIAYWSVVGSSPSYVIFMGITELLAGTLLLFSRTRFAGLLLTAGIFVNVVMVNVSFDISVKLFSLTLLGMTIVLLAAYPDQWRALFQLPVRMRVVDNVVRGGGWKRWVRAAVLSLMVVEAVYPTVVAGYFYDDAVPRKLFHGAYRIYGHRELKNLYVHRHGYLIVENHDEQQADWKILSQDRRTFRLLNERTGITSTVSLQRSENGIVAVWTEKGKTDTLRMKELPYRSLPLFDRSVHWFSDQYH